MPSILTIPEAPFVVTTTIELPINGLAVDPRPIGMDNTCMRLECTTEGKNLTVTRIDSVARIGWHIPMRLRSYNPAVEKVPDFTSNTYRYHGLDGEKAPYDVEEVVIDPSVRVIKEGAFNKCPNLKKCIMENNVERIEKGAFMLCGMLENIQLSKGLRFIGENAFGRCESIQFMFIPSNVQEIQHLAFNTCTRMKVLALPAKIDIERIGEDFTANCHSLLPDHILRGDRMLGRQFIMQRYDRLPLFRLCNTSDVTAQMIRDCVRENGEHVANQTDGRYNFTPLHILVKNPYASLDEIIACLKPDPAALFSADTEGLTPHDYLWADSKVDIILHLMKVMVIERCKDIEKLEGGDTRKRKRDK